VSELASEPSSTAVSALGTVELTEHDHGRSTEDAARPGPVAWLLLQAVRFYRTWISPVLPPSCRFEPSCSAYALDALTTHGALRGTWHPGGWDPVPPRRTRNRPDEPSTANQAHPSAAEE
jgi:putative membrane protein insertion efficiency factor